MFAMPNMGYDSSRVISELSKHGQGSKEELRKEFNYFKEEFKEGVSNQPSVKGVALGLVGRGGIEFQSLEPFKTYTYNGGNEAEFEKLKKAAGENGFPPTIQDYTKYKEMTNTHPDLAKHTKVYPLEQALRDEGTIGSYMDSLEEKKLPELKKENLKEKAEMDKFRREEKRKGADASDSIEQQNPTQAAAPETGLASNSTPAPSTPAASPAAPEIPNATPDQMARAEQIRNELAAKGVGQKGAEVADASHVQSQQLSNGQSSSQGQGIA